MRIWLTITLLSTFFLHSKILILTHAYNRPDFIKIQEKMFKRFLRDEYEFVVFSDACDPKIQQAIHKTCKNLHIKCIDIPQEIHSRPYLKRWPGENYNAPSARTSNSIQYSLNELGFYHNDLVVIIDSDLFLVKNFSIREYLGNAILAGVKQERDNKHYLWNGLVFINMPVLPEKWSLDFNCGRLGKTPVDSGGQTYHYLKKHPTIGIKYIEVEHFSADTPYKYTKSFLQRRQFFDIYAYNFLIQKPDNVEFLAEGSFLHYRSGGNWDHKSSEYHTQKTCLLNEYIQRLSE